MPGVHGTDPGTVFLGVFGALAAPMPTVDVSMGMPMSVNFELISGVQLGHEPVSRGTPRQEFLEAQGEEIQVLIVACATGTAQPVLQLWTEARGWGGGWLDNSGTPGAPPKQI